MRVIDDLDWSLAGFGGFGGGMEDEEEERSPVDRLRELIEERQEESLEILKSWMEDEGEKV